MATYTVELYRTVTEVAYVTVDASGTKEAELAALERADESDWDRVEVFDAGIEDVVLED